MNTIRNTWTDEYDHRVVTIEIRTALPAGAPEFALMGQLAAVVERYRGGQTLESASLAPGSEEG